MSLFDTHKEIKIQKATIEYLKDSKYVIYSCYQISIPALIIFSPNDLFTLQLSVAFIELEEKEKTKGKYIKQSVDCYADNRRTLIKDLQINNQQLKETDVKLFLYRKERQSISEDAIGGLNISPEGRFIVQESLNAFNDMHSLLKQQSHDNYTSYYDSLPKLIKNWVYNGKIDKEILRVFFTDVDYMYYMPNRFLTDNIFFTVDTPQYLLQEIVEGQSWVGIIEKSNNNIIEYVAEIDIVDFVFSGIEGNLLLPQSQFVLQTKLLVTDIYSFMLAVSSMTLNTINHSIKLKWEDNLYNPENPLDEIYHKNTHVNNTIIIERFRETGYLINYNKFSAKDFQDELKKLGKYRLMGQSESCLIVHLDKNYNLIDMETILKL